MVNKTNCKATDGNCEPHASELHGSVTGHGRGRRRVLDRGEEEALLVVVVVGALAAAARQRTASGCCRRSTDRGGESCGGCCGELHRGCRGPEAEEGGSGAAPGIQPPTTAGHCRPPSTTKPDGTREVSPPCPPLHEPPCSRGR